MASNNNSTSPAFVVTRSKIVNKDGTASWEFVKVLQNWTTQISSSLSSQGQLIGQIAAAAKITGRTEGIGTTVGNINSAGVITPAGLIPATPSAQGAVILPAGAASNTLGSAALASTTAFDAAGAAATAQSNAEAFATSAANTAQTNAETFASNASNITTGMLATALFPGVSGTVTLAALTGTGTQGSLTLTKGLITAFVNPT